MGKPYMKSTNLILKQKPAFIHGVIVALWLCILKLIWRTLLSQPAVTAHHCTEASDA